MSSNINIINRQKKIIYHYVQNLQTMIHSLCKIIQTLVIDSNVFLIQDQVPINQYTLIQQLIAEINQFSITNHNKKSLIKSIESALYIIDNNSSDKLNPQINQQFVFPALKTNETALKTNEKGIVGLKSLATIAQKQSSQNIMHPNIKDNQKKNLIRKTQVLHKTIYEPNYSLNNSREYQVIRQQTKKSLQNPVRQNRTKKPLYRQLQKLNMVQQYMPAVKRYLNQHTKKNLIRISPNYTISKFL